MKTSFSTNESEVSSKLNFYKQTAYDYYDGEDFITFDVISVDEDKETIYLAVSNRGKISVIEYDLLTDNKGYYFYYGSPEEKIHLDQFEEVA